MFKNIYKFVSYWYFRYLLVTELYMVEKWERVVIHIVFLIVFSLLSLFNTAMVLPFIDHSRLFISNFINEFHIILTQLEIAKNST